MTIQSAYTSSYLSRTYNLGGTSSSSAAALGFAEQAQSNRGSAAQSAGPPPRMSESDLDAAKSKLKEIDSSLADKMEQFNSEIEDLKESGASRETVQAAMKENMDSLSDTEKSELEQVFGKMPGESSESSQTKDPLDELISSLSSSNPDLAEKLQSLQDQVTEMRENGESEESIQQTVKDTFDSLSENEQSSIQNAIGQQKGPQGPPPGPPPGGPPSSETDSEDSITDLISSLQTTNSSLAEKLQGFEDQINELKDSGADEETVQNAIASNLSSLSETEKTDLLNAIFSQREADASNSTMQTSYAQAQAASVYGASGYLPYDPILAYSA